MTRQYLNNYETLLTQPVLAGDLTIEVGTPPPALAAGDFYRLSLIQRDPAGVIVKLEFVDVTNVTGSVLTITRGVEGTAAAAFDISDEVLLDSTAQSYGGGSVADHVADPDPHTQYTTRANDNEILIWQGI